jgi:PAS domain S-box-containing protein
VHTGHTHQPGPPRPLTPKQGYKEPPQPLTEDRRNIYQARLELLAANTSTVVWHTAKDGRIDDLNPSWEVFTGQTFPEYVGWGWLAAIHPDDRERVAASWKAAIAGGLLFWLDYRLRRRDGQYRLVQAQGTPAIRSGEVQEWVGVCTDVTSSKQLEQRLQFLDKLNQSTRFLTDANQVVQVNCELLREHLGATHCGYGNLQLEEDRVTIPLTSSQSGTRAQSLELFGQHAARIGEGGQLIIRDADRDLTDESAARVFRIAGVNALACAGLVRDGRVLAVMAVCQERPRDWTAEEIKLLVEVLERCWTHIHRVRVTAEPERALMTLEMAIQAADLVLAEVDYRSGVVHLSAELALLLELGDEPMTVPRQVVFDRIHPEDWARYLYAVNQTVEPSSDRRFVVRVRALLPSGTVRWFHIGVKVAFASIDGRLQADRGYCAVRDVTREVVADRELRATQRLSESVIENAGALVYAKDLEGRYVLSNHAFRLLFGVTPEAIDGAADLQLFSAEVAEALRENDQAVARSAKPLVVQEKIVLNGEEFIYRSNKFPLYDDHGRVYAVCGISTDITDVVQADRRKDQFIATLAHELRNPLAPIRTGLEILKLTPGMPPAATRARDTMERQLVHMVHLVDDLLDVSRITRDRLEIKRNRLALVDVVEHAVEGSRPAIDAARHELSIDLPGEPVWIQGDLTRLAQVLGNLLNNAAKYTPHGGHIELTARVSHPDIVISVIDDGTGLAPSVLPHLFDLFFQKSGAPEARDGGLGIGLWLVKKLVELHGGTVQAFSDGAGRGATVTLRLPLLQAAN